MHNNFIVLGGYKLPGYCTWKEELKKTKHINYMQNLSPILRSALNPWITLMHSYTISHQNKNSRSFQHIQALSAKILLFKGFSSALEILMTFQGFSRNSRSSTNTVNSNTFWYVHLSHLSLRSERFRSIYYSKVGSFLPLLLSLQLSGRRTPKNVRGGAYGAHGY